MTDAHEWYEQKAFDVRCEWGLQGVIHLAPACDAMVIVDVLSFCTSVAIAVDRGAIVYPYSGRPDELAEFAAFRSAEVAGTHDSGSRYSLSPESLIEIPDGTRIVLPSPNGSALSAHTGDVPTIAGCLRNARAVARLALSFGPRVAVIPAGERWRDDGSLRPSFEDLTGAGAIISHLPGARSPDAQTAAAAFLQAQSDLLRLLRECASGRELISRGRARDVALAAELDVSNSAPLLEAGAFRSVQA